MGNVGASSTPRDPVQDLVEQVELGLERPAHPIYLMDRFDWATAINSEMPWHLPGVVRSAAIVLEQRYRTPPCTPPAASAV